MEERMVAAIRDANAGDRVQLLGRRDDMDALYNAADAVILSSQREGFSNAVIEALACGKPVIAADVGGNREAISSWDVGWIHGRGDDAVLTAQIAEALARPDKLREMEGACRERGLAFSLDALVDATATLYREALTKART